VGEVRLHTIFHLTGLRAGGLDAGDKAGQGLGERTGWRILITLSDCECSLRVAH
jgi:hypothetical protein